MLPLIAMKSKPLSTATSASASATSASATSAVPQHVVDELLCEGESATLVGRFLLIHHGLRRDTQRLASAITRAAGEPGRATALQQVWTIVSGVLHGHHRMEDVVLFPALVAIEPALADVVASLNRDHAALDPVIARLDRHIAALPDRTAAAAGSAAAEELSQLLAPHLATEEEALLPALRRAPMSPAPADRADPQMTAWLLEDLPSALVDAVARSLLPADRAQLATWRSEHNAFAATCWIGE